MTKLEGRNSKQRPGESEAVFSSFRHSNFVIRHCFEASNFVIRIFVRDLVVLMPRFNQKAVELGQLVFIQVGQGFAVQ